MPRAVARALAHDANHVLLQLNHMDNLPLALFTAITGTVAEKVRLHVPLPFIDEQFHLRQCQQYCRHNFHLWDPKITTPPGLYVLGTWWNHVLKALMIPNPCGFTALRLLNLFAGLVVLPLVLSRLHTLNFWILNIVSLPLLYSYYFLFYTDVWSTVLVVVPIVMVFTNPSLKGSVLANLAGFASLWLRQTNIVWLLFSAVLLIDRRKSYSSTFSANVTNFTKQCFKDWLLLVPYLVNGLLFAGFIVTNGGITFGDKENHAVTFHLVQVFYCFSFMAALTAPVWLSKKTLMAYFRFAVSGRRGLNVVVTALLLLAIREVVARFTIVHPFLLADNRHYTFYIYRKILSRRWSNVFVVPAYHFALWLVYYILSETRRFSLVAMRPVTTLAFFGACVATLVPLPLFEPRYYIVPLVVMRIFAVPQNHQLVEFVWYQMLNCLFFVVFFSYQFAWRLQPGVQRIIW